MIPPNADEVKARERESWAANADGWNRQDELLRKCAAPVTERMLDLAGIGTGDRHLDIASGLGEPAISAAHRVGPDGYVLGTDITEAMLEHARAKARRAELHQVDFRCVDGESLDCDPESFDAATIRWGLMFMPQPGLCARLAYDALKKNGRFVTACWSSPDRNPFVGLLLKILGKYMDLPKPPANAPGIFALADPDKLTAVISSAGFHDIRIEELEFNVIEVDHGQAYWDTMSDLAAPVMRLVRQLALESRKDYIAEVIETADNLKTGDTLQMSGVTWIASGNK